jgi:hypothetical protein
MLPFPLDLESLGYLLVKQMTESVLQRPCGLMQISILHNSRYSRSIFVTNLGKGYYLLWKINFLRIIINTLYQRIMENIST